MTHEHPVLSIGKRIQENRRARGLTQEQLAQQSGIPYTTLTKIESGAIKNPSLQAVSCIAKALDVSLDDFAMVETYRGENSIRRIWADILETLVSGETMYISGISEGNYLEADEKGIKDFIRDLTERGLSQKLLSCHGDYTRFEQPNIEYRWIPRDYFLSTPMYVYKDKIAMVIWEPLQQAIILRNSTLAEAYRRQFLFMWQNAETIPETKHP